MLNCNVISGDTVRVRWKSLRDGFRKELKKVPKAVSDDGGPTCSDYSTWPHFKRMYFLKDQFTYHASNEDLPSKQNRILREDHTETRDEQLESSQFSELDDASMDVLDIKVETFDLLDSNAQRPTSGIEPCTTKHGTKRSHEEDADSTPAETERTKLRVKEEERSNTSEEDVSFFESLIPHIKGLPPARKMLLRMKIQELIYNFVYKQEL
jgi:hypothetical protein